MPFCNMCERREDDPLVSYTSYKIVGNGDKGPKIILCRDCQQEQTNKVEILNNETYDECMTCDNDTVGPKSRFYFFTNNHGDKNLNWICRDCNSNFKNQGHFVRYWNNQENIFSRRIRRIAKILAKRCIDVNENGTMTSSLMIDHEITKLIRFSLRDKDGAIRREFLQRTKEAIEAIEQKGNF